MFWGGLGADFFFHLCFFFFFFFSRTPADLLDKMLLILLGVLVLHLIILILLIVSTAASVSNTSTFMQKRREKKTELHDNDVELRLKIAGRCPFETAVLLFVPDLDCRWRQNQRSVVQLPDKRRGIPLQTGQRCRFG